MPDYTLSVLYSGSTGNSTLIKIGSINILIDAGKSARSLCSALKEAGSCIEDIDAIFITHEHTDHISALNVISKKHKIPIHTVNLCADRILNCACSNLFSNLCIHPPIYSEIITKGTDTVTVSSFATPHDSMASVGYKINFQCGNGTYCSIGYATDIGHITPEIKSELLCCETVVLESNHDENMLIKGCYPFELKKRILSQYGHLSNTDCADFALELIKSGTKNIILAHLSEENNTPNLAFNETYNKIKDTNGVALYVASPCNITTV